MLVPVLTCLVIQACSNSVFRFFTESNIIFFQSEEEGDHEDLLRKIKSLDRKEKRSVADSQFVVKK